MHHSTSIDLVSEFWQVAMKQLMIHMLVNNRICICGTSLCT
uniref:Uncharacterized protein n=1 Tax=Rhizophora mucronata TaxID=61149 RepID=A0A2P2R1Y9_RHIMU